MVVVANKGIFGGGTFSMKGEAIARMVGQKRITPYHIQVAPAKGVTLYPDGVQRNAVTEPYMPKRMTDPYHPGGNSICYGIQTAFLMGADPIYALGFTLRSGSRYFWGDTTNPILRRSSIYDARRAVEWLSWFESQWPGRVQLVEGWDGPVYDALPKVTYDELRARLEKASPGARQPRSEENGGDASDQERLRSDGDEPIHWTL